MECQIKHQQDTLLTLHQQLNQLCMLHSNFYRIQFQFDYQYYGNQHLILLLVHQIYIVRCVILMCSRFPMQKSMHQSIRMELLAVGSFYNYSLFQHILRLINNTLIEFRRILLLIRNNKQKYSTFYHQLRSNKFYRSRNLKERIYVNFNVFGEKTQDSTIKKKKLSMEV